MEKVGVHVDVDTEKARASEGAESGKERSEVDVQDVEEGASPVVGTEEGEKKTKAMKKEPEPLDLVVLQSAFKRAAWYSLALTAIVTIIGAFQASFIVPSQIQGGMII